MRKPQILKRVPIYEASEPHTSPYSSSLVLASLTANSRFALLAPAGKSQGSFKANSKALAEGEGSGIAKVLFNEDTGKVVGVHIIGIHAADLIQECSNAVACGTTVKELSMLVHTHPTLCEVLDEAFKGAVGMSAH